MKKLTLFMGYIGVSFLVTSLTTAEVSEQGQTLVWAGCGITKKAFMSELAKAYQKKTGIEIILKGGGATKGIRSAASGKIHIGGACRVSLPSHSEERNAYQIPVAWDALVVIVNKNNPVNNITIDQLRKVYLGKITNWKQLGGNNQAIELYSRKSKLSGVGRTLRELVFADYKLNFKNVKYFVKSSGPLEKGVVKNIRGIGTTGISSAKKRNVKILRLNGIKPSYENIKSGEYLIYRPLYLVRNIGVPNPMVADFIKFALSTSGKKVIRAAGTVPYADAMVLVMKQLEQYSIANKAGLLK